MFKIQKAKCYRQRTESKIHKAVKRTEQEIPQKSGNVVYQAEQHLHKHGLHHDHL